MTDTTARPWAAEGRYPTLDELDAYLLTAPPEARVETLDRLLSSAQDGARCVMADHDAYPTQVDRLLTQLIDTMGLLADTTSRARRWRRLATRRPSARPLP